MEITAVVIARGGSKRIKEKSLLPFGEEGDNLITHKIKQLKLCKNIDRIIFGSDSQPMINAAENAGAEVFKRDDFFCDEDNCSINEAIYDMVKKFDTDIVLWAHCTNPLLGSNTYDEAVTVFLKELKNNKHDSLLSVLEIHEHIWGSDKKPLNYNPWGNKHPLAKTLPAFYIQDGGIFIQKHKDMLVNKYFFNKNPVLFKIPENEFSDINTYRDYVIAKELYRLSIDNDL